MDERGQAPAHPGDACAAAEPDVQLREFLRNQGLARDDEAVVWTPLAGGVSSDIWRVDLSTRSLCIKRALPQLKVAQVWNAPIERNAYEWAWINFAAQHCPANVPVPVAADAEHAIFAMGFLDPEQHPTWKSAAPCRHCTKPGCVRGGQHPCPPARGERQRCGVARGFAPMRSFMRSASSRTCLRRHAVTRISRIAYASWPSERAATRVALVHGDVSPKNILVGPKGPIFLDAECAWFGDPAFDAAFCLNHFLLKCIARPETTADYLACYGAFSTAYLAGVTWESRDAIEARIASLLPALFLARIDGKSPVEYITEERDKQRVRDVASPMIASAPTSLDQVMDVWRTTLAAHSALVRASTLKVRAQLTRPARRCT